MTSNIEHILSVVSEVCDIDKDSILSKSRKVPLPTARGFFWYVVRKTTSYSNGYIAKVATLPDARYTGAAIGVAINKAVLAIYKEKYWKNCWDTVMNMLNITNERKSEDNVAITIVVPKGKKHKFNVEIKERKD